MKARNPGSRDSIGRDDIVKAVREQHRRLLFNQEKGSNAGQSKVRPDPAVEENTDGAVVPMRTVMALPAVEAPHRRRWWFGRGCR